MTLATLSEVLQPALRDGYAVAGLVTLGWEDMRAYVAAAEAEAVARFSARRMEMTVIALRAELIAWYGRRGYAATGETRPFPVVPPRPELDFVVLEKPL